MLPLKLYNLYYNMESFRVMDICGKLGITFCVRSMLTHPELLSLVERIFTVVYFKSWYTEFMQDSIMIFDKKNLHYEIKKKSRENRKSTCTDFTVHLHNTNKSGMHKLFLINCISHIIYGNMLDHIHMTVHTIHFGNIDSKLATLPFWCMDSICAIKDVKF